MLVGCGSAVVPVPMEEAGTTTGTGPAPNTVPGTTGDPLPPESLEGSSSDDGGSSSEEGGSVSTSNADWGSSESGDEPTSTTGPDGLGDGEQCSFDWECASDMCFVAGALGGICSSCLTDDDCDWGCSIPNPLAVPPEGASCGDGDLTSGCESDDACQDGLTCGEVLDVPGILAISTCGECTSDADCGAQLCSPQIDVANVSGAWTCVGAGTVPDGDFCELDGSGNQACASGYCGEADVLGLVMVGVCSECSNHAVANEGCGGGETCADPIVNLDGSVSPGSCV